MSFDVEDMSYGKFPEGLPSTQINTMDKIEAQLIHSRLKFIETVYANGHFSHETVILNSDKVFAEWPTEISRIFSDSTGTKYFDKENNLWRFEPANVAYLQNYNETRAKNLVSPPTLTETFPIPTALDLNSLQSDGYLIDMLPGNIFQVSNNDEEMVYDPTNLRLIIKTYTYGKLESDHRLQYTNLENFGIVPSSERLVSYVTRPSGMCMEKISARKYSNYDIESSPRAFSSVGKEAPPFQIWPVPANDILFVQVPNDFLPGTSLRLLNAAGDLMLEKNNVQPGASFQLDINFLPTGVYYLNALLTTGPQIQKLIKQ